MAAVFCIFFSSSEWCLVSYFYCSDLPPAKVDPKALRSVCALVRMYHTFSFFLFITFFYWYLFILFCFRGDKMCPVLCPRAGPPRMFWTQRANVRNNKKNNHVPRNNWEEFSCWGILDGCRLCFEVFCGGQSAKMVAREQIH